LGNFSQWIERLSGLYKQKTRMRLYPGTLNLELPSDYSLPADVIRLEADEYGGTVSLNIVPCRIFDRRAFLLRTDQNAKGIGHHPRHIIEIATDVRLRDHYLIKDGGWVEIEPQSDRQMPRRWVPVTSFISQYRPTRKAPTSDATVLCKHARRQEAFGSQ
jgi:hypothetical protein